MLYKNFSADGHKKEKDALHLSVINALVDGWR